MNSPYLPNDCVYDILKHFQDDRSTLFNCLLVNRFWCKESVPLLYANPFEHLMDFLRYNPSTTHKYTIIFTLIICFDRAEILRFKNQLTQFNININNNTYINDENEPLFEYPKYLENYHLSIVNGIIFECFANYLNISHNHEIIENFIPIFHQSNLRKSIKIKQFGISFFSFYNQNYNIQSITQNLTKLNSLSLQDINVTFKLGEEFLKSIANICLNLQKLEISSRKKTTSKEIKENFCTIIQNQNKLKAFKISQYESLLNDILLSLEFQKHSLVYIEFESVNFRNISFENFITLYNLKYLYFNNCKVLSINQCDLLNFALFKLKELTLTNNTWNNNVTLSIIKYLGESLQKLYFYGTILIIEYLPTYCLNLNSLKIRITPEICLSVFPYFKNLKINELILLIHYRNFRNRDFTDKMMENLTKNFIPINVKKISIRFYFDDIHNTIFLGAFLENCHHQLETINLNINNDLENLKIILNFIKEKNNNLKLLGMKKLERVLTDEETKLLNQIKTRGVTLMNFSSIYRECSLLTYRSI